MNPLPSHVYAVILAGGSGTRFWPKSRHLLPKQLCKIGDNDLTMLELTLSRLDGIIPPERRIIVTHRDQMPQTRAIVGSRCLHFLAEPVARNTAPALALAAVEVKNLAPQGSSPVMISLHADALIRELETFQNALHTMRLAAEQDQLALLGVTPSYPETGYGYIEKGSPFEGLPHTSRVLSFREKPHLELAQQYLSAGSFLWNSGIFAWKADVILEELDRFVPVILQTLKPLLERGESLAKLPPETLASIYKNLPQMAIDPAVLERSRRVLVLEADIGWKDVGSWDSLDACFPTNASGNLFLGPVKAIDCERITVDSDGPLIACIGVSDLVIVSSGGAILVCPKSRAQDVKLMVELLKAEGRSDLV